MNRSPNLQHYLISTLRSMVGVSKDKEHLLPPLSEELVDLFLRTEERENGVRDQWGNWEHPFASNYRGGKLWLPEVDLWVEEVRKELTKQGVKLIQTWPGDAPFAVCLTHDVDIISERFSPQQLFRKFKQCWVSRDQKKIFTKLRRTAGLAQRKISFTPSVEETIGAIYRLEKEFDVPSTYFLFANPLSKISQHDCVYALNDRVTFCEKTCSLNEVFQQIGEEGCEIGLHGSYFTATDATLLEQQKQQLEKALGLSISSTRQHFLHWDSKVTPQVQAMAGIRVDGTIGYNRNIGFRSGTCYPFYAYDHKKDCTLPMLEIPLIVQDGALFGANALELHPKQAYSVTSQLIDSVATVGGCMTLLLHPDLMLLEGVPDYYRQVIEYCKERGAWFATFSEIEEWWSKRINLLEECRESNHHRCSV